MRHIGYSIHLSKEQERLYHQVGLRDAHGLPRLHFALTQCGEGEGVISSLRTLPSVAHQTGGAVATGGGGLSHATLGSRSFSTGTASHLASAAMAAVGLGSRSSSLKDPGADCYGRLPSPMLYITVYA